MGKGTKRDALANSGTANAISSSRNANADSLYNQLNPIYTAEATNPQGYDPKDLAAMNTATQQSVGGANAAAAGEGSLAAARTRNAGGFAPAIAESARSAMRENSNKALEVQANNALQRERNRQSGITGLSSLYGDNSSQALQALGLSNQALDVANHVQPSPWQQFGNTILQGAASSISKIPSALGVGG